jgi:hypothetical protein
MTYHIYTLAQIMEYFSNHYFNRFIMGDNKCSVCNNTSGFACSQCKTKKYCSNECQKSDWATHKHVCGAKMMAIYCCDPDKVDDTIQNHNINNYSSFGKFRKTPIIPKKNLNHKTDEGVLHRDGMAIDLMPPMPLPYLAKLPTVLVFIIGEDVVRFPINDYDDIENGTVYRVSGMSTIGICKRNQSYGLAYYQVVNQ